MSFLTNHEKLSIFYDAALNNPDLGPHFILPDESTNPITTLFVVLKNTISIGKISVSPFQLTFLELKKPNEHGIVALTAGQYSGDLQKQGTKINPDFPSVSLYVSFDNEDSLLTVDGPLGTGSLRPEATVVELVDTRWRLPSSNNYESLLSITDSPVGKKITTTLLDTLLETKAAKT